MPVPLLDLTQQYASIRTEVDKAISEVVASQRFILGPVVEQFEAGIAARTGARHAIGCASGTDALLLSLKALPLEPGAEVIVPAFTFFATAGAVWNAGFKPVFCDIDPDTFNVTADTLEAAVTPQSRAVIVVHLYGQMADMTEVLEVARRRGLFVIEDAAQSIGARQEYGGRWSEAGTLGDTGCLSFFPTKNLGGFGDGGMIVCGDDALAERLRKLRVHGGRQMYHHEMVGTNSRLDSLQAAVLSVKLPYLDGWTERRRENAAVYDELLSGIEGVQRPVLHPKNCHVYNQYTIRARSRDALKVFLDGRGIGNSVYYPVPLHLQECFATLGGAPGDHPVSEAAAGDVLSLPVFPELTRVHLAEVAAAIEEFYATHAGR